jgi:hypothetical protein
MAITFVQQKNKQKTLLWIFGILVIILGIFLTQFLLKRISLKMSQELTVSPYPSVRVDFKFLESQTLKDLEPFEGIGPFEGVVGRDNPFVPYSATQ